MKLNQVIRTQAPLVLALALSFAGHDCAAQTNAFTYQGRLSNASGPVNGHYGFTFQLFDAPSGGNQVNLTITNVNLAVSNGLFSALLNFGTGAFPGADRWLQVGVRTNGSTGAFVALAPRQPLTPAPYSLFASVAATAATANNVAANSVTGAGIQDATITAGKIASGQVVKSINGLFDSVTLSAGANVTLTPSGNSLQIAASSGTGWSLTGNSGTTPAANFLGTMDNKPLELRVNGGRALRLEPSPTSPNVIGGYGGNSIGGGAVGATVGGGGKSGYPNVASGSFAVVGGGYGNTASGTNTTISGGSQNSVGGFGAVIGGGYGNTVSGDFSAIGGGFQNIASGLGATVAGGQANTNTQDWATIGGGVDNTVSGYWATVSGGMWNIAGGQEAVVGGGVSNTALQAGDTVGGGEDNAAVGSGSTVAGGSANLASGWEATISGGQFNTNSGTCATIAGGRYNTASAAWAAVPGGLANIASGGYSFAGGFNANATHQGAFVWGDSTGLNSYSTASNQFTVHASGGARFLSNISSTSGVSLAPGGGSWSNLSDRNTKENFTPADARQILDGVAALPISTWNYRSQEPTVRHIGPVAQDFAAAFGVGEDEKHITTIDESGVALAAIQGLNAKLEEKVRENETRTCALRTLTTPEAIAAGNAQRLLGEFLASAKLADRGDAKRRSSTRSLGTTEHPITFRDAGGAPQLFLAGWGQWVSAGGVVVMSAQPQFSGVLAKRRSAMKRLAVASGVEGWTWEVGASRTGSPLGVVNQTKPGRFERLSPPPIQHKPMPVPGSSITKWNREAFIVLWVSCFCSLAVQSCERPAAERMRDATQSDD
jgi:hypothetical protein